MGRADAARDGTTGIAAQRAARRNRELVAYTVTHLAAVVAEWVVFIGVLVYAFDRNGATGAGVVAVALQLPYLVAAPIAGALAQRHPPQRVRLASLVVQAAGYAAAAAGTTAGAATPLVAAATMIALAAVTALRPAGATLLPAIVRSSGELTVANVWTGYCDSAGVLVAPLFATAGLALGGAAGAMWCCASASAVGLLVATVRRPSDPPGGATADASTGRLRSAVAELRSRPGALGVLAVVGGQYLVVGGFDIVFVVAADELGMGSSGAGVLGAAFGVGALASVGATTSLVRRPRLAGAIAGAMVVIAVASAALGLAMSVVVALLALPFVGLGRSTLDVLGRVLLHRSAPPEMLASVFAVVEMAAGVGLFLGSLGAQSMIALGGPAAALLALAGVVVLLLAASASSLPRADASADVPVVARSLLRQLRVFAPLPRPQLETIARAGVEVPVAADQVVIAEGEPGDRFYAITDGSSTCRSTAITSGPCSAVARSVRSPC